MQSFKITEIQSANGQDSKSLHILKNYFRKMDLI
jgi:hypothetical protein